ncbi:hypothetical protein OP10G_0859 [Fimbriimonas ginsengisoli Gsoil 348]|uniref:ARG and Rhodanese-Phosphatase-superfamily-associated domain-containing protein n=1 Tax=Fimbriimonas ginsengisoli Gsoil 348 TaxID=661478 RepID=A0A068NLD0_FIMGI|nr:hypothetical protein OP10G_0859 [Fimbriimonas ginsengisoli Gsoil 348]
MLALGGAQAKQTKRVKRPAQAAKMIQAKLTLGQPVQLGSVAVVPIESTLPLSREEYMTLFEAMKLGVVKVIEVQGGGEVNDVEVENNGTRPILLLAGELLLGGQQDRIVAKDCIVAPHERRRVPVFCVEHGRWNGTPAFQAADTLVVAGVRATASESQDQTKVWAKVAETNGKAKAAPSTGTIRGTLNDPTVKKNADRLLAEMKAKFHQSGKTVGMIFWLNGKVESADIFGNPNLFAHNRDKLLKSYSVDAQLAPHSKKTSVDQKVCSQFLADIVKAGRSRGERSAMGNTFRLQDGAIAGYESGNRSFSGGLASPSSVIGGSPGGLGHGTYHPKDKKGGG